MKKIYILLIIILFIICGCNKKEEITETKNENEKIDIKVENKNSKVEETVETIEDKQKDNNSSQNNNSDENDHPNTSSPAAHDTSQPQANEPMAPVCTPKKFSNKYTYVYKTEEECKKEGNLKFLDLSDTVLPNIFVYSCDVIVDDCGETYYGVSFYDYDYENSVERKVYY